VGQLASKISTGTGWDAALLSHLVGEHGRVITVEVDPAWRSMADTR
jgi:protein-L-isoaspartate O-methyltransferase